IAGTVADQQGAVVAGAQVKATNIATGVSRTAVTDNSGLFRFSLIPAGTYKLEITAKGFKTGVQSSVLVGAGQDASVGTIKLTVGEVTNTVEVSAEAPLIETTNAQVTNTFAGTALQTFAGIQENQGLDNLALFVPGVNSSRDLGFSNTNGGSGFAVNGLRGRNNDQQIDGQNNNYNSVGGPGLFVSDVEFVQQYVLVTNQFGPEYGRNAGSVVNVITKSGSNAWHGSVYATENNSVMNAMTNNTKRFLRKPDGSHFTELPRLNDEFGGFTIGGPFVKNKLFFFSGVDQEIISTIAPFYTDSLTPTPAGLATLNGCFPASTAMQAYNRFGPYAISAGTPTPHPVAQDPIAPDGATFFPTLNVGACPNVQFGGISRSLSAPTHNFNFVNKMDWQLGSDSITARYLFNRGNAFNLDFGDAAAGYPVNVPALSQVALVTWTHNLSSHMVNEARISYGRLNVDFGGNSIGTVPTGDHLDNAAARVTFRLQTCNLAAIPCYSFLPIGTATNLPQFRIVNTWQAQDNWNYVMGKHTLKAGINWTYQRSPNGFLPNVNGAFQFNTWSTFAANTPRRVTLAAGPTGLDFREYDTFLYGGDDWKITQSLTLNFGLTWSYYGQPANLFNEITTQRESGSGGFWLSSLPLSVRTFPTFPSPKNSFGPSLGFAYSPQWGGFLTGHGKTVIRGGYRFLYDPPFYNIYLNMATAAPEVFNQTFSGAAAASKPLPANILGSNIRSTYASALTPGVFDPRTFSQTTMSPDFGPDKVSSYSLGVERELSKNAAVEVRYAGNRAYNLFQSINGNPFIADLKADFPALAAGLTPCATTTQSGPGAGTDLGRVNCGVGVQRVRTNTGYSYYNSLQTEIRANNLFKQLTIRSGYTFSKTLDNVSEIFGSFAGGGTLAFAQNPLDFKKGEYSFSGLDVPHTFSLLINEEVPWHKDQKGLVGHVFGGWSLSGNYIWSSGQRFTPSQIFITQVTGAARNYYDSAFFGAFNGGAETARPFLGNPGAPITAVGILASDACDFFGACVTAGTNPNQLLSFNALNQTPFTAAAFNEVKVTKNDVRFIANGAASQALFGTPFGNVARNSVQDAPSNIASASIIKRVKLSERMSFEFHATALNVFNHFNFQSIDPFLEDSGLNTAGTGFGDPKVTGAVGRRILIGGKFNF
ncbi:MAG: TonB-dependent receptor, partial [Acidobacteriia bacterium]|nr:TonB-dependent receptor [Terriglobia bacterium]